MNRTDLSTQIEDGYVIVAFALYVDDGFSIVIPDELIIPFVFLFGVKGNIIGYKGAARKAWKF